MKKEKIIEQTAAYVKKSMSGEETGHDWFHVYRVWKTATKIGKSEKANLFIVQLASLLHDIADWKFSGGDLSASSNFSRKWLESLGVEKSHINHICDIIKNISFKGSEVKNEIKTIEGMVVQDADRLDAIGAIGISRAFAYSGYKGSELYNPDLKPQKHKTFEEYKKSKSTAINHFYEKLLLIKDMMNTETGRQMAEKRHNFMKRFLERFFKEWEGKE